MLEITARVSIPDEEIELSAIRSQGAGGQNVNKVATAIHLRFDIHSSSLPESYKEKLLALKDSRITKDGVIIIKSQSHRTQELNKEEAFERLRELIQSVNKPLKKRIPTKPSKNSQKKRVNSKKKHGQNKTLRKKPDF